MKQFICEATYYLYSDQSVFRPICSDLFVGDPLPFLLHAEPLLATQTMQLIDTEIMAFSSDAHLQGGGVE